MNGADDMQSGKVLKFRHEIRQSRYEAPEGAVEIIGDYKQGRLGTRCRPIPMNGQSGGGMARVVTISKLGGMQKKPEAAKAMVRLDGGWLGDAA